MYSNNIWVDTLGGAAATVEAGSERVLCASTAPGVLTKISGMVYASDEMRIPTHLKVHICRYKARLSMLGLD